MNLARELRRALARHRRWAIVQATWRLLPLGLVVLAAVLLLLLAVDAWVGLDPDRRRLIARGFWSLVFGLPLVVVLWLRWRWRTPRTVARQLEVRLKRCGEPFSGPLGLALDQQSAHASWMAQRSAVLAIRELDELGAAQGLRWWPRWRGLLTLLLLAGLAATLVLVTETRVLLRRTLLVSAEAPPLGAHHITLALPVTTTHPLGSTIEVVAEISPSVAGAELELRWADGRLELRPMTHGAEHWQTAVVLVDDLRLRVRAGGARSAWHRLRARARPQLTELALKIQEPAYTGRPERPWRQGIEQVLAGSRLHIQARSTAPLAALAWCAEDDGQPWPLLGQDRQWSGTVPIERSGAYRLILRDQRGQEHSGPRLFRLSVRADTAPEVACTLPQTAIGSEGVWTLQIALTDDSRIETAAINVHLPDGRTETLALDPTRPRQTRTIAPRTYGLTPGDELGVTIEAIDDGGQRQRQVGPPLRVVTAARVQEDQQWRQLQAITTALEAWHRFDNQRWARWNSLRQGWQAADPVAFAGAVRQYLEELDRHLAAIEVACQGPAPSPMDALPRAIHHLADWATAGRGFWRWRSAHWAGRSRTELCRIALRGLGTWGRLGRSIEQDLDPLRDHFQATVLGRRVTALVELLQQQQMADRAWAAWAGDGRLGGLTLSYWPDITQQGPAALQLQGAPMWDQARNPLGAPGHWSLRASGGLFVPTTGAWQIAVRCDDGVRLRLNDGPDLFAGQAWRQQPPTLYSRRLNLEAGWHALDLDYFQLAGRSVLNLLMAPAGAPLTPVPVSHLRYAPDPDGGAALISAMASVSLDARQRRDRRLRHQLSELLTRLDEIANKTLLDEASRARLRAFAAADRLDALALRELRVLLAEWDQRPTQAPAITPSPAIWGVPAIDERWARIGHHGACTRSELWWFCHSLATWRASKDPGALGAALITPTLRWRERLLERLCAVCDLVVAEEGDHRSAEEPIFWSALIDETRALVQAEAQWQRAHAAVTARARSAWIAHARLDLAAELPEVAPGQADTAAQMPGISALDPAELSGLTQLLLTTSAGIHRHLSGDPWASLLALLPRAMLLTADTLRSGELTTEQQAIARLCAQLGPDHSALLHGLRSVDARQDDVAAVYRYGWPAESRGRPVVDLLSRFQAEDLRQLRAQLPPALVARCRVTRTSRRLPACAPLAGGARLSQLQALRASAHANLRSLAGEVAMLPDLPEDLADHLQAVVDRLREDLARLPDDLGERALANHLTRCEGDLQTALLQALASHVVALPSEARMAAALSAFARRHAAQSVDRLALVSALAWQRGQALRLVQEQLPRAAFPVAEAQRAQVIVPTQSDLTEDLGRAQHSLTGARTPAQTHDALRWLVALLLRWESSASVPATSAADAAAAVLAQRLPTARSLPLPVLRPLHEGLPAILQRLFLAAELPGGGIAIRPYLQVELRRLRLAWLLDPTLTAGGTSGVSPRLPQSPDPAPISGASSSGPSAPQGLQAFTPADQDVIRAYFTRLAE